MKWCLQLHLEVYPEKASLHGQLLVLFNESLRSRHFLKLHEAIRLLLVLLATTIAATLITLLFALLLRLAADPTGLRAPPTPPMKDAGSRYATWLMTPNFAATKWLSPPGAVP